MYEHVIVESVNRDGTVSVGCDAKACGNCSGNMFCNVKHRTFPAKNPQRIPLVPGDVAEVFLPPGKTVFSTFMTLMVPLALFPAGYFVASALAPQAGELVKFFAGIGGVMVGFLIAWAFFRKRKNSYIPVIASVVADASSESDASACVGCSSEGNDDPPASR